MTSSNYIVNVAIVGGGGNSGRFMTESLLKTGKHNVTILTRTDSQSQLLDGVTIKRVDYSKPETLIDALRGQDALIITLAGQTPKDTEQKLITAAGEAGVPWILPNEWAPDSANEGLVKDVFVFQSKPATRKFITDLGKSNFISISTGFWYEWSLAIAPAFGFDFANRSVTFFDEGETKISVSTWPQIGRAVAALLSLPIKASDTTNSSNQPPTTLSTFANKLIYISSFTLSQKDMLASVLRVTNTQESQWSISHQPSAERYAEGIAQISKGEKIGFAKMMYTRVFYPDGCGDTEGYEGCVSGVLGLDRDGEDLDEATGRAIERAKRPQWV